VLGVIVAMAVQGAREIALLVLGEHGLARDRYVSGYGLAIEIATHFVVALAAFDAARRLVLARKLGAQIAACASLAIVALYLARVSILYLVPVDSAAHDTVIEVSHIAWVALMVTEVAGFAIAAGRRGAWLGVLAAAFVLLRRHPQDFVSLGAHVGFAALVIGECVLVGVMAREIGRIASRPSPDPVRATRALRWLELVAWLGVAFGIVDIGLHLASVGLLARSLASVGFDVIADAIWIYAIWSIARAAIPQLPRWSWLVAATCATIALVRTMLVWAGTLLVWWGRLDAVPLKPAHWIVVVPADTAFVLAIASLAVFARRTGSRELMRAAAIALALVAIAFVARVAFDLNGILALVVYIALRAAAALVYRAAQPLVVRAVKLTDVFS
jgi:hypothetical protein